MTNLMQQLQAWADEGRYTFPTADDAGGFTADLNDPEGLYMKGEGTERVVNSQMQWAIEMVLNGTIQVWRPVELYPPPPKAIFYSPRREIKTWKDWKSLENGLVSHWMPLPQLPKEGE